MTAQEDESVLDAYGIQVPVGLWAEEQQGISNCFLSRAALRWLKDNEWRLIKCDRNYAVAVARDFVGVPSASHGELVRQPLILTIAHGVDLFPDGRTLSANDLRREVEDHIRQNFRVAPSREALRYWVIARDDGSFFGPVTIMAGPGNSCTFSYHDNPLPQTKCHLRAGGNVVQLETNSTDYEAIQAELEPLSKIDWASS